MARAEIEILEPEVVEPWDRQPGEPSTAFLQFAMYRDAGLGRSYAKLGQELGITKQAIEEKATQWAWVDRVAAYDRHCDVLKRHAREAKMLELADLEVQAGMASLALGIDTIAQTARALEQWQKELDEVARGERSLLDIGECPITVRDGVLLQAHGSQVATKGLGGGDVRGRGAMPTPTARDDAFDNLLTDPEVQKAARAFTEAAAESRRRELERGDF